MTAAAPSNVTPIDAAARELAALEEQRKAAVARREAADKARQDAADSPEAKLAEARLALAREKRAADLAEHEAKADAVYRKACAERGEEQVMRILTREGSIVIRAQTEMEEDAAEDRAKAHLAAPGDKALASRNADTARQLGFRDTVLTDLGHFDRIVARHHRLWPVLWGARNALVDARIIAEGKDGGR